MLQVVLQLVAVGVWVGVVLMLLLLVLLLRGWVGLAVGRQQVRKRHTGVMRHRQRVGGAPAAEAPAAEGAKRGGWLLTPGVRPAALKPAAATAAAARAMTPAWLDAAAGSASDCPLAGLSSLRSSATAACVSYFRCRSSVPLLSSSWLAQCCRSCWCGLRMCCSKRTIPSTGTWVESSNVWQLSSTWCMHTKTLRFSVTMRVQLSFFTQSTMLSCTRRQHGSQVRVYWSEIVMTGSTCSGSGCSKVLWQSVIAALNSRLMSAQRTAGSADSHAAESSPPPCGRVPAGLSAGATRPPCKADSSTSRFTSRVARRAALLSDPGASCVAAEAHSSASCSSSRRRCDGGTDDVDC